MSIATVRCLESLSRSAESRTRRHTSSSSPSAEATAREAHTYQSSARRLPRCERHLPIVSSHSGSTAPEARLQVVDVIRAKCRPRVHGLHCGSSASVRRSGCHSGAEKLDSDEPIFVIEVKMDGRSDVFSADDARLENARRLQMAYAASPGRS